jgi:hypothetical protein
MVTAARLPLAAKLIIPPNDFMWALLGNLTGSAFAPFV